MERSRELLLATQDQRPPHGNQDKEIGHLYFKSRFNAIIEDHPKCSGITNEGVFEDASKRPAFN